MKKFIIYGANTFLGKICTDYLDRKGASYQVINSLHDLPSIDFKDGIFLNLNLGSKGLGSHLETPFTNLSETFLEYSILKYASDSGIKGNVNILPNCIYPDGIEVPFKETDVFNGNIESGVKYYANSKKMLTLASEALTIEKKIGTLSLVSTAIYGPGDNFGADAQVLPSLVKKFVEAKRNNDSKVTIWGSGRATREFLFVQDVPEIIFNLIDDFQFERSELINLSSGLEVPLLELAEVIKKHSGYNGAIDWDTSKPEGILRKCLQNTRLKGLLPNLKLTFLEEGIKETITWYEKNY